MKGRDSRKVKQTIYIKVRWWCVTRRAGELLSLRRQDERLEVAVAATAGSPDGSCACVVRSLDAADLMLKEGGQT